VLIEEDVRDAIASAVRFSAWLLGEKDSVRRLSECVVLAALAEAGYLGWKTRAEHDANPNRVSTSVSSADFVLVPEQPRVRGRASIHNEEEEIAEDLVARLRRELKP
jgi:hypothetical protein